MKTCAVIVTYGNRFHLLKKVIEGCLEENVDKLIVVDNNSLPESRENIKKLEKEIPNLEVIYLDENKGSAGGYKIGLQKAYNDEECEFIWLLDDDNKPEKGSLKILKDFWKKLNVKEKEKNVALLSYRPLFPFYKETAIKNDERIILGRINSFIGFHVLDLPYIVVRFLKRVLLKENIDKYISDKNWGIVPVAPYGGLFFHKKLIDIIGYPMEELFLYQDDFEYTYRITEKGGKIYLILNSIVEDLEKNWAGGITIFHDYNKGPKMRVCYTVRNRVYFDLKYRVTNKPLYILNMILFKTLLFIFNGFKSNKVFNMAVEDGMEGKLGKVDLEKLG
ncbi:glycosyltransferase [Methanothermococcus sp. SCGC AD-155-N22]|nr:glycosyltransferase [Methanothermococcus sp. SCGC AD-155-N22]